MDGRPKDKGRTSTGEWTEVQRREKRNVNRWDNNNETTFFVENLPDGISDNVLWRYFGKVGRLSDAYVAKKKDAAGNKFGFLRFLNVKDIDEILDKANEIRVQEAVIKVSLARFDRNHRKFVHPTVDMPRKQGPNQPYRPTNMGGERFEVGRKFYQGGLSYKEVVKNQQPSNPMRKTIRLNGEDGILQKHWIGKAVIGEGKDAKSLEEVQRVLVGNGMQDVGILYVGGMKTLIIFHDKKQALEFVNNQRQVWGEVFEAARLWNEEDLSKERVVKLNIRGIPIQLRDEETYNEIGKSFGRVVGRSEFSWSNLDVSVGSCLVVVSHWEKVDEVVNVEWKNRSFEIQAEEGGWTPEIKETIYLEEGEFRQNSPKKMEENYRKTKGRVDGKVGGEESHMGKGMHEEGQCFNSGGESANKFNMEGGMESYAWGFDPVRKKKRRRTGRTPNPLKKVVDSGDINNSEQPINTNGPDVNGLSQQTNWVYDENVVTSENTEPVEGTDPSNENSAMETESSPVQVVSEGVNQEVNETIRTGEAIGIQLNDFRKDVEALVNGDGVYEVSK